MSKTTNNNETKMAPQAEPSALSQEELAQVSGGQRSVGTMYKTNPGITACCGV